MFMIKSWQSLKKIKVKIYIFGLFLFIWDLYSINFDKVVLWGYKLHSHTHSYIHYGFYNAFRYLGYEIHWFDDSDDVSAIDFSKTLFITAGGADDRIPLRNDCYYILHNVFFDKYKSCFELKRAIKLQVYTTGIRKDADGGRLAKFSDGVFYSDKDPLIYMCWATDLLPCEIDKIKKNISFEIENKIYWIGTLGKGFQGNLDRIEPFIRACQENGVVFQQMHNVSREENISLVQRSFFAPTIVGEWQEKVGYVPCRIFKNISYGKIPITNSEEIYHLFEQKVIYNPDTYQLFYDAKAKLPNYKTENLIELMNLVKEKHTYLNRIDALLNFFEMIQSR